MKTCEHVFIVRDYDLAVTLTSGQAFRWQSVNDAWEGVVAGRWVRLTQVGEGIHARTIGSTPHWQWLANYLQAHVKLADIVATFPADEPMSRAMAACHGLRLLRQEPWECLASFILSSTKQIVQIQQIVRMLCERLGEPVPVPKGHENCFTFPSATRIAACAETELRECKMGFRAPNLLRTAKMVSTGEVDIESLGECDLDYARAELLRLPGVGEKIANCVLLFAYGFQDAFPVDVWVMKALRELYFPRRRPSAARLSKFIRTHFGPNSGYAQQYLFHYMRLYAPAK